MKLKVIACEIFRWIVEMEVKEHMDLVFIEIASHNEPAILHDKLQKEIDASQEYDVILLLYGICGNAIIGLCSPHVNLYVFRAHDCSSVFLGTQGLFINERWSCFAMHQQHLSFQSLQSVEDYEQLYGSEHGRYLWEIMSGGNELAYLSFHRKEDEQAWKELTEEGYHINNIYIGSKEVVQCMLHQVSHPMIYHVPKNKKITGIYDFKEIISSH